MGNINTKRATQSILTEAMNNLARLASGPIHQRPAACVCGECVSRLNGGDIHCAPRMAYRMIEMARTVIKYEAADE
jgi:hypothetical protein